MPGLLLVNLGTPDAPTAPALRRYLRAFLGDPRVIDLPAPLRWLLLELFILPWRPRQSARAYRSIWEAEGSPLLVRSRALAGAVAGRLGHEWQVVLGMRYGSPSIGEALEALDQAGSDPVVVLPLFPHAAASTRGSALAEVYRLAGLGERVPVLRAVGPFYDHPGYLDAQAARIRGALEGQAVEHVLFSFHGLPERHLRKADPTGRHCLAGPHCCETPSPAHRTCYRHQCLASARALAERAGLSPDGWSVAFQSRLGRSAWLEPATASVLEALPGRGVRRLAVVSASFVTECLETLEELGIRGRATFEAAGGEHFVLVPALDASEAWVTAVADLARAAVG